VPDSGHGQPQLIGELLCCVLLLGDAVGRLGVSSDVQQRVDIYTVSASISGGVERVSTRAHRLHTTPSLPQHTTQKTAQTQTE